jgi:hypothetical protein
MPLPATIGNQVVGSVGIPTGILASEKNLVVFDANFANYLEHDWCEAGVSAPGASAGIPQFPVGALLGWNALAGVGFMQAQTADQGVAAYVASPSRVVYTWCNGIGLASRGNAGAAVIPASMDSLACVLAKEVDIEDMITVGQRMIVPVIWQGEFTPRGIVQDKESYTAAPWPTAEGACDRLAITPKPGWMHG